MYIVCAKDRNFQFKILPQKNICHKLVFVKKKKRQESFIQRFWVLFGNNIQHFLIIVNLLQASNVKVSLGKKRYTCNCKLLVLLGSIFFPISQLSLTFLIQSCNELWPPYLAQLSQNIIKGSSFFNVLIAKLFSLTI